MAEWRFLARWSDEELAERLASLRFLAYNYQAGFDEMTAKHGWTLDGNDQPLGSEPPGPPEPDGLFSRSRQGIVNYYFSDPRIVIAHFDPSTALPGRDMLLEVKVFGFRFLTGVRVHQVRQEADDRRTIFGFRYDTLEGHLEQGAEWFVLTKDHASGEVRFRIEARWRFAHFPNWWMRVGFQLVGEYFRKAWRDRAPHRLRELARKPIEAPTSGPGRLERRGDTEPTRTDSAA